MELINYDNFYKLNLGSFIPGKADIKSLDDWEFMDGVWHGEAVGFSEWIMLNGQAKEKSISLDLNDLSDSSIDKILSTLRLEVRKGMRRNNVIELLGQPKNVQTLVSDRVTLEYIIGGPEKYYLSLTITDNEGLIYLVLMNHSDTINRIEQYRPET